MKLLLSLTAIAAGIAVIAVAAHGITLMWPDLEAPDAEDAEDSEVIVWTA